MQGVADSQSASYRSESLGSICVCSAASTLPYFHLRSYTSIMRSPGCMGESHAYCGWCQQLATGSMLSRSWLGVLFCCAWESGTPYGLRLPSTYASLSHSHSHSHSHSLSTIPNAIVNDAPLGLSLYLPISRAPGPARLLPFCLCPSRPCPHLGPYCC